MMTATYSPEDNKLRLYSSSRLDAETYARVKAAGFKWAPAQELFVAPAWTPEREDLLIELAGEIEDEDKSLVERAEERADRFEDYSASRAQDAERAHNAVAAIANNIPLGQPILVGHHSERHARRDAEKIERGMRRAVDAWKTSKYWEDRAKGAIRHAKYKELPAVRARRIKGIEAEIRKIQRSLEKREACRKLWESCKDLKQARYISGMTEAGYLSCCKHPSLDQYLHPSDVLPFDDRSDYAKEHYPTWTLEQVKERAADAYKVPGPDSYSSRWIEHLNNRLTYERAMLQEQGGTVADQIKPEKGGAVRCWASPGHGNGWSYIEKVNKVSVSVLDTWDTAQHETKTFRRVIPLDKLRGVMTAAQVNEARAAGRIHDTPDRRGFYLQDAPSPDADRPMELQSTSKPETTIFDAMEKSLRAGVQVVSAPQLFPTPEPLARRVVELADIEPENRVLEPSAGTGRLVNLMSGKGNEMVAVEINHDMADSLRRNWQGIEVVCGDFLEQNGNLGKFDRVVMNPPFANAQDITHIQHARTFLKPGGRLVAICANGPRQRAALMPQAEQWIDLEPGSFQQSGTNVNAAIVVFTA